jgi:hypothetical protein
MPLKLNVGLSKKVGLPDYGSLGASCHVEVELAADALTHDLDAFQNHVRRAFVACRQAVQEELAKQGGDQAAASTRQTSPQNGHNNTPRRRDNTRRATASQVRAINAIADRQNLRLEQLLEQRFGVTHPSDLSISEASALIDELKGGISRQGAAA